MGLFVAFSAKLIIIGAVLSDAPILAILAGFSGYLVNRDEEKNLEKIKNQFNSIEQKAQEQAKAIEELRSHVSTIKLGQQVKSVARF